MKKQEIQTADRASLVFYLESYGFACFDNEPVENLRVAAILNHQTESGDQK